MHDLTWQGLEIVGGRIGTLIGDDGRVRHIAADGARINLSSTKPAVSSAASIATAAKLIDGEARLAARLAVAPIGEGRLVWLISADEGDSARPWMVMIDAQSGAVLEQRRIALDAQAPDEIAARHARSRQPAAAPPPPAMPGPAVDPCDESWTIVGPAGETFVAPDITGSFRKATIALGISDFGAGYDDTQAPAMYGAGIALHACMDYTITISWDLHTWDSYSSSEGYWDVFFVNANPIGFVWDLATSAPLAERACDTGISEPGSPVPGPIWSFGGLSFMDEVLCSSSGTTSFTISEPFHEGMIYLSAGLDTAITGGSDSERPSWGTMTIEISAATKIFDPNPVVVTGDPTLIDEDDADSAIPCPAYSTVTLGSIPAPPLPAMPWMLGGPWVTVGDFMIPPECAIYADLSYTTPASHDGTFPTRRACDLFEGVMAYAHIDASQAHIQSLGYTDVNARSIMVDPHGFAEYNAFYCPDGSGTGMIFFGDGGGDVDSAEDAEVILHEYAHAIQDNQAPDAWLFSSDNNCFGNETRAWGEGFADAWSLLHFFTKKEASGGDPLAFAQWFGPVTGLRNAGNDKEYPLDMVEEVHEDGEIVSGAIMDLYLMLRGTIGSSAARSAVEKILLDGNFLVPMSPDFGDAAEAMIAGDLIATGGTYAPLLGGVFMARGFLEPLIVHATADGAPAAPMITVTPSDVMTLSSGSATFGRLYPWGEDVVLTAPASFAGLAFSHWTVDGEARRVGDTTLRVGMRTSLEAEAVYLSVPLEDGAATLTQSTSATPVDDTGPVCHDGTISHFTELARSYDLGAMAATAGKTFLLRAVDVAVELNEGRSVDAEVRVYRDLDGGAPGAPGADLELLGVASVFIPALAELETLTAAFDPAIEVAPDTVLVVEWHLPKHCHARLFPGCNSAGQSAPTWFRAFACGYESFVTLASIGLPSSHLVQSLHGDVVVPGDLNGDGVVDFSDLLILLAAWGACPAEPADCPADLDASGMVDFADLLEVLANWS